MAFVVYHRKLREVVSEPFPTREAARRHLVEQWGANHRLEVRRAPNREV